MFSFVLRLISFLRGTSTKDSAASSNQPPDFRWLQPEADAWREGLFGCDKAEYLFYAYAAGSMDNKGVCEGAQRAFFGGEKHPRLGDIEIHAPGMFLCLPDGFLALRVRSSAGGLDVLTGFEHEGVEFKLFEVQPFSFGNTKTISAHWSWNDLSLEERRAVLGD